MPQQSQKAYIFGAGSVGMSILPAVLAQYEVIAFLDSDKTKQGRDFEGYPVLHPAEIVQTDGHKIIVASLAGVESITEQLIRLGAARENIVTYYVDFPIKSRITFLEGLGKIFHEQGIGGCVAEGGVFLGEFAKEINRVFPASKFYLFDTFSGFDPRDLPTERENKFSRLDAGHFNITSVETVRSKLPHPENCVFKKGFFPETTDGIDESFCFVNLDFDLYQPTLAGLEFFYPRMVKGGAILIHDYFAETFKGVKAAVHYFSAKTAQAQFSPIGDGSSVLIRC